MKKQLIIGVLAMLSLCGYTPIAAAKTALFDELTIHSPLILTHPVTISNVSSHPGNEIVTLGVDKDGQSWLIVYQLSSNGKALDIIDQLMIDKSISRFDISAYHDGVVKQIYFMNHQTLFVYQPSTSINKGEIKNLGNINSLFLDQAPSFIARDNFIAQLGEPDINYIISAHFNGLTVYDHLGQSLNDADVDIKPQISMSNDSAEFTKQRTYIVDVNFDNKKDIVMAGDGQLIAYIQGNTVDKFTRQTIEVNDTISGINWWNKRDASGDSLDQTNLVYRSLDRMLDINGDDIVDLVVKFTQSSGLLDRANNYEIYFGKNNNGQLSYDKNANTVVTGEGTLTGLNLIDINNDKKLEVLLSGFDIGVSQIIGALLSGSIDQDVYLYQLNEQSAFTKDANVEKEVELNFSISSGQTGSPVIELLDINNDGLKDLMLSNGEKRLDVFLGQQGKRLFSKRAKRYKTMLPKNGNELNSGDINNDGKDDIVFKYGRLDGDEKRRQFKVLLSK